MGNRAWHLARAKRHKEVADFLRDSGYEDWAMVALAYAAHAVVHSTLSGDPALARDERHPRKHTSPPGSGMGGRGTNQLVNAAFPHDVAEAYSSLFEMGRRSRYDVQKLGPSAYRLLELQYRTVFDYCAGINASRPDRSTQEP